MTTIDLPDPDLVPVALRPHERVTLGNGEEAEAAYGRVALGVPTVQPLTQDRLDEDAQHFLASRSSSRFVLLTLTASFTFDESQPFETAWVDVRIAPAGEASETAPVAWSMRPVTEADPTGVVRTVTVDASLKLSFPGVPVEAGPSASRAQQETFQRPWIKIEALGEGTSSPRWVFYRTDASDIRGMHRLCLVLDIPSAVTARAEVSVGATLRLRRFKVFRYTAALQNIPDVASVLLPPP